ncbi:MAG: outer membrane lipoprotein carrier protein LolA [Treponema sp.]|nr:outer membrane lipoprotein carrier protein LolA [Treponema sp.]
MKAIRFWHTDSVSDRQSRKCKAAVLALTAAVLWFPAADVYDHPLSSENSPAFTEICTALSEAAVQRGNFTQTKHIATINRSIVSSGTYIIAANSTASAGGIVWQTKKPFASTMTVSERGILQTTASGKQTKLDAAGNATFRELSAVISSVFRGDAAMLTEHFTVFFEQTAEKNSWQAALKPKDSTLQQMISSIVMTGTSKSPAQSLHAARSLITSITMNEPSGDSIRYDFSEQRFSTSLSEEEARLFAF